MFNMDELVVGTPATEHVGSDAYAYYVVGWKKNQKGDVREVYLTAADEKCDDWYGNDWHVEPFNPEAKNPVNMIAKKNRKGYFTTTGTVYGSRINFGYARPSRDPSF